MSRLVSGPAEPLFAELRDAGERHRGGRLRVAVAWSNDQGVALLLEAAGPVERTHAIVGINNQGTTVEGLLRLLGHCETLAVLSA